MARSLGEIITHIRACIADSSIRTTLIQTEDLAVLCDAAAGEDLEILRLKAVTPLVEAALTPKPGWKVQPFEYYAAHFLVGSGLMGGDLYGRIKSLAAEMKQQYDLGVEHGCRAEDFTPAHRPPLTQRIEP